MSLLSYKMTTTPGSGFLLLTQINCYSVSYLLISDVEKPHSAHVSVILLCCQVHGHSICCQSASDIGHGICALKTSYL